MRYDTGLRTGKREVVFPGHRYSGTRLTAVVHGSVPRLLTVSDAVRNHARCEYRPPGMSGHLMVLAREK